MPNGYYDPAAEAMAQARAAQQAAWDSAAWAQTSRSQAEDRVAQRVAQRFEAMQAQIDQLRQDVDRLLTGSPG